ncbi:TrmB family transcriptional regulator [Sediminispirochaeta smaragdinae]|jgi:sugar-specific transcriptional regulator TrmB|uniref:Transcriptional regulator, TrmB n=1 Tax=Sediminispirochaeta smaragdinae (strain DSM 11293 / JCM 15392 / SEBR 4228) TaxID=573413 RepID=E1RAW3_SEDSS|nr:helix-turn-helix domain-containing protein [Sediminispirochaeta smaragdinae]ADK79493.1 transcriptional regulator, TrmB [Sediminispirochaeta smaragdinae DSM 11293]
MKSDIEETLSYFKEMGFTEYEAKVYLSLLAEHPASAYTISQNSGVPHSRVYDVTRRLIKQGLAASSGTKPELFSPLSPGELIEKLRREYEVFTDELEKRLTSGNFISDFDPVWNLPNRSKAIELAKDLIGRAKSTIYIGIWQEELGAFERVLRKAEKQGVKVYMLLYGEEKPSFGEVYLHETENMDSYSELGHTLDCTVDSTWCITGTLGGQLPCQIVWTKNRGLVQSIQSYISHDFYLAELHHHFGDQIDRLFGKNLTRLRKKFS